MTAITILSLLSAIAAAAALAIAGIHTWRYERHGHVSTRREGKDS